MFSDLTPFYPLVVPFLLVMFRLLGVVAFVPFFSNSAVPGNVKVLLGLAVTVCVWNVVPGVRSAAFGDGSGVGGGVAQVAGGGGTVGGQNARGTRGGQDARVTSLAYAAGVDGGMRTLAGLVVAVAGELTVGLLIGLMLAAVFGGIQLGAHLVSQQMGLSMATLYDPAFEDQSTVIEQIAFWIALVAFLAMGGHREVINAVVYSYQKVPVGSGGLSPAVMVQTTIGSLDASFHAAARVAMPALVAFFVATLTSGLMARSMPQMNLMTVGIAVHLLVGFVMVGAGLVGWAAVSRESLMEMFRQVGRVLQ